MAAPHDPISRTVRHSRAGVVDAALRILDDQGLPDLTMRHLAGALDVQPSALYWHFPNKQTLLAAVSDRIVEGGGCGGGGGGVGGAGEPIRAAASALRAALLSHRDGAELVSSTEALGLGSGAALARLTDAVASESAAGGTVPDPHTTRMAATALLHFILGHVSHEQQRMQYRRLAAAAATGGIAASGTGPASAPDGSAADDSADDEAFDFGIGLFVEGLARVSSLRAAP